MKTLTKNLTFAALSLILVFGVFSAGFYFGTINDNSFLPNGKASANEKLDLEAFWKAWSILEEKFVPASDEKIVTDQERVWGAIKGLTSSLGDPYTVFFPPVEKKSFEETISGNFEGVGMEVGIENEVLTVISPLKDTPAFKAGIKAGDKIIEIDGKTTANLSIEDAVSRIRGKGGTTVVLKVVREGEKDFLTFNIVRGVIDLPTLDTELREDRIFVISLYNFSARAPQEFRNALREFISSGANKLVIDLRGNPGGYLDGAIDISSWFLPSGKVVVREDFGKGGGERSIRSKGYNIFNKNLELVILVDGGSASASEIVAGALQEHGIATLVGKPTFGKGSVQELVEVTEDTSLKVTIARWLTPNGKSISDGGLTPDFIVETSPEDAEKGIDAQLEKAVEILKR